MWARENDFMATGTSLPEFRLFDASGSEHLFPSGRTTVLCFAKHDCPTCELSMPLLLRIHEAFGDAVDVWAVSQDAEMSVFGLLPASWRLTVSVSAPWRLRSVGNR